MTDIEKLVELITSHSYGSWRAQKAWKRPLFIAKAEGACFYDDQGRAYLDFSSQLMCSNLGHGNRALIAAIKEQAERLPYVAPGFVCEAKARAVEALLEAMPEGLDQFFFSSSGTEANEAALKIVRQYLAPQGKYKIISRYRSYHGSTGGSIALTGDFRRWFAEPMNKLPGVIFAPDAYCYRCPFGLEHPGCQIQCAEYVDYMIKEEGNVAAIFIEPVVGTNGIIVPPPEYLPRLRQIADENGVLLVADEVMSGWYRTGKRFAVDHWDVKPDILTTAKGCTGAYAPVGVTATTAKIRGHFEERFFAHGHTYSMHPLTLAAIPAAIAEYKKLFATGLPQRVSEHLAQGLRRLFTKHKSIGDVRGLGHFWAVELVKNRETKEPFSTKADKAALKPLLTERLSAEMLKRGVYLSSWYNHFVIAPPLIITEAEIDRGLQALDEVLEMADHEAD
ncbi:MAG: aminotransferase class III-fold pyridoxal phosphate-dependent enzyme [Candidatus Acetothermia bacterium]|jgi:taurine--2-oxoglutarate transaminase|nr:aminotransferase class III-fold pyridoxal phosphate-dependent enzyme [Candidatus Acetothermia bacterium]MDH7504690.1 aminotransferase class III-fold pyridoxal phosphate-dependent enzyme [Candidatus Acetothermia bacterium]